MVEGTGLIESNGKSYVLSAGDMILFHPKDVHAIYSATNVSLKYEVMKFDVNKLYTENNYAPKLKVILNKASKDSLASAFFKEEAIRELKVKETFEICREELERYVISLYH